MQRGGETLKPFCTEFWKVVWDHLSRSCVWPFSKVEMKFMKQGESYTAWNDEWEATSALWSCSPCKGSGNFHTPSENKSPREKKERHIIFEPEYAFLPAPVLREPYNHHIKWWHPCVLFPQTPYEWHWVIGNDRQPFLTSIISQVPHLAYVVPCSYPSTSRCLLQCRCHLQASG